MAVPPWILSRVSRTYFLVFIMLIGMISMVESNGEKTHQSLVVISAETSLRIKREAKTILPVKGGKISSIHVTSNIGLRYARTEVSSLVKNPSNKAQALDFRVVLPESAFISNFSMTIKGKVYVAQVKEKEEARKVFDKAVSEGRGAAIVEKNVRDSNHFAVSTNVAAGLKVQFKLTYEELLERRN